MINQWTKTSLVAGLFSGLVTYYLTQHWQLSCLVSIPVFLWVLAKNPKKRFMRVFWILISLFIVLNRFAFQLAGEVFGLTVDIKSHMVSDRVSITLLVLAALAFLLDYLERKDHLKGTFLAVNKNIVKNTSGENITIQQNINRGSTSDD